jgi:hypothetical protein
MIFLDCIVFVYGNFRKTSILCRPQAAPGSFPPCKLHIMMHTEDSEDEALIAVANIPAGQRERNTKFVQVAASKKKFYGPA